MICTATISGQYGLVKGRNKKPMIVTGNVTWSANTGCGTTTVTSGTPGTATCTTTALPVGTDTVEGDYSGDSNHQPGSGTTSQTVNPGTSSIAVTSVSPNTEVYGQDVTVTITAVLSWTGSAAPTGAVTIGGTGTSGYSATTCGAPSGSTMTCTASYTPTVADGVGSYTESATFAGDTNYNGSSSTQTGNFTITGATAATTVASNNNPSLYNQPVTLTATINGQYGLVKGRKNTKGKPQVATGTVAWTSNGVGIAGCNSTTVSGDPGVATCTTSSLAVGTDTIEADYSGDSNHSPSSGTLSQVVNSPVTTLAVTSVSPSSEDYGANTAATITAVLSWTGNGPTPTGAVTISGNGPSATYSATTCGAPSSNTITCTATYTPTASDVAGSYTESATYAGDTNYNGSSSTQTNNFAINSATSTTSVTSDGSPSTYGAAVTFTATISGENGMVKGKKPSKKPHDITGNVTWSGNTGCSTSVVSGYPGVATCTTSGLAVGSDTVTATYAGDVNHGGSSGSVVQNVTGGVATSIAVTNVNPAAEDYNLDSPVTITAVLSWTGAGAAPTGAVTIGGNGLGAYGATTCGAASGNTITCTATYTPSGADTVGSYTETATFAGDSDYAGSSSTATNNFAITAAATTTGVVGSPNPSTYASSVTFTATINAANNLARRNSKRKPLDVTGNVSWSANTGCSPSAVTPAVGTGVGTATCTTSAATHLPVGTDVVTATYLGDSNHSGSTGSENQVVQGGLPTTIDVTSVSPATEDFGANSPATITAVLSWTGNGVAPTGSNVTISGNGNGTYSATSCAARVHKTITCTATYTPSNADVAGSLHGDGNVLRRHHLQWLNQSGNQ